MHEAISSQGLGIERPICIFEGNVLKCQSIFGKGVVEMDVQQAIRAVERVSEKPTIPEIRPGDTVRVHYRFTEEKAGEEEKTEKVQVFEGVVIKIRGTGAGKTFTVRRIGAHNIGIERIFPLYSPNIEKIEIVRRAKVRRSKLYYLRGLSGKAARLKEKRE